MIIKKKKNKRCINIFLQLLELFLRYCWHFGSVPKRQTEAGRFFFLVVILKIFLWGFVCFNGH